LLNNRIKKIQAKRFSIKNIKTYKDSAFVFRLISYLIASFLNFKSIKTSNQASKQLMEKEAVGNLEKLK